MAGAGPTLTVEADAGPRLAPAGWQRLLQFLGLSAALLVGWIAVLLVAFGQPPAVLSHPAALPQAAVNAYGIGLYVILMGSAWWIWTRDGQRPKIAFSGRLLAEGWAMGLVGLLLLCGIEALARWLAVRPGARLEPLELASAAAVGMLFATSEEALFRGFVLGLLRRDLPRGGAIAVSAALFAVAHFLHPVDWRTVALPFLGLWCAGALLATVRLRTGSLWPAVGLHASWVWYITASGQSHWWIVRSRLWTGGGSPAAGLLGPVLLTATYLWVRRRWPEPEISCGSP